MHETTDDRPETGFGPWLSERLRSIVSVVVAVVAAAVSIPLVGSWVGASVVDASVFALLAYVLTYLVATAAAFATATPSEIRAWAMRDGRGTFLQRYVLGTAPGPGVTVFISVAALVVAMVWLPGHGGTTLPTPVRLAVGVALIVVGWSSVVVSFAVTFHADNLVEKGEGLDFPGKQQPEWSDYVYFAFSVMTTFGTTDVNVTSREMRRTVTANAVIAFVFNTVTVAAVVSALTG